jgi:REP element-mobilizing transposase RayT
VRRFGGCATVPPVDGPAAYFLTFTTHGTWLHGDDRGSVIRTPDGSSLVPPNPRLLQSRVRRLHSDPFTLSAAQRQVVADAIAPACTYRGWDVHALHVRTNHVHLLVAANAKPEAVLRLVKAWATRRLREAGLVSALRPVWTVHGSTRYVWTEEDVASVWTYIVHGQGEPLEGGFPTSWA